MPAVLIEFSPPSQRGRVETSQRTFWSSLESFRKTIQDTSSLSSPLSIQKRVRTTRNWKKNLRTMREFSFYWQRYFMCLLWHQCARVCLVRFWRPTLLAEPSEMSPFLTKSVSLPGSTRGALRKPSGLYWGSWCRLISPVTQKKKYLLQKKKSRIFWYIKGKCKLFLCKNPDEWFAKDIWLVTTKNKWIPYVTNSDSKY
jgi:hypothetical protein